MGRYTDMTVTSNLKLTRAYKYMPAEERTAPRDLFVSNGDLYFSGDRAWFKVENFMKSSVDFRMRIDDLRTVLSMKGDIEALPVDQYSVRFSNGSQNMLFHCHVGSITLPPNIVPLPDASYVDKPELFTRSRGIDGLIDDMSTAGIITHNDNGTDYGYLVILKDTVLAIIEGEPGMDIDLSVSAEVLSELTHEQTKVNIGKKIIQSRTETDGYTLYTYVQHSANRFPDKVKNFVHTIAHGSLEMVSSLEPITEIEIKVVDFIDAINPILKMKHEGYINIESSGNMLKLSVSDTTKNTYETEIECTSSDNLRFESVMITPAMVNFLISAVKTTPDKAMMKLLVNPWKLRMVIRMTPNDDSINALCMMKILV